MTQEISYVAASVETPAESRIVLRSRCHVKVLPDERLVQRERLISDVWQELYVCSFRYEGVSDLIAFAKELASEPGAGSLLHEILTAVIKKIQLERPRDSFDAERAQRTFERIEQTLERIEWIDKSLILKPPRTRKIITMTKPQTTMDAARARRMLVKAKKMFETTDDMTVVGDAALLVAFCENEQGMSRGQRNAAAIIAAASGAPSEKLLDKLATLEDKFGQLKDDE